MCSRPNSKIFCPRSFLSIVIVLIFAACSQFASHPDEIEIERIDYSPPKPLSWSLDNGVEVLFMEDREIPTVRASLYTRGGSLFEPERLAGLASATGYLMRAGGTKALSPAELDLELDSIGASIDVQFTNEYGNLSFFCLKEDLSRVSNLFRDVVLEPRLDSKRLATWKQISLSSIKRRRESANTIASMTFNRLFFGKNSAYYKPSTPDSIREIGLREVRMFHQKLVQPQGSILTISGSLNEAEARELASDLFGAWKSRPGDLMEFPDPNVQVRPGVYLVQKPFDQSVVVMGHAGISRDDPRLYRRAMFDQLFGLSGFDTVLFREVRSKAGLAYTVWGGFLPASKHGQFRISVGTKNEQAAEAVNLISSLIKEVRTKPFTEDDLLLAERAVTNGFVFKFPNASAIVNRGAVLKILGFPEDYDESYLSRLKALSAQEVLEFAQELLAPEKMIVVVVGDIDPKVLSKRVGAPVKLVDFDYIPRIGNY